MTSCVAVGELFYRYLYTAGETASEVAGELVNEAVDEVDDEVDDEMAGKGDVYAAGEVYPFIWQRMRP